MRQLKISVDHGLVLAFKQACLQEDTSMAATLTSFMAGYIGETQSRKPKHPHYATKRQRRAAIKDIIRQLEEIISA